MTFRFIGETLRHLRDEDKRQRAAVWDDVWGRYLSDPLFHANVEAAVELADEQGGMGILPPFTEREREIAGRAAAAALAIRGRYGTR